MTPRTYPGRDKARILRRAQSLERSTKESFNLRANCCRQPAHRELPNAGIFTTRCENCGTTV